MDPSNRHVEDIISRVTPQTFPRALACQVAFTAAPVRRSAEGLWMEVKLNQVLPGSARAAGRCWEMHPSFFLEVRRAFSGCFTIF